MAKPRPRPPRVTRQSYSYSAAAGPRGPPTETQTYRPRIRGPVTRPWDLGAQAAAGPWLPGRGTLLARPRPSQPRTRGHRRNLARPRPSPLKFSRPQAAPPFPDTLPAGAGPEGALEMSVSPTCGGGVLEAARCPQGGYPALALARNEDLHRGAVHPLPATLQSPGRGQDHQWAPRRTVQLPTFRWGARRPRINGQIKAARAYAQ